MSILFLTTVDDNGEEIVESIESSIAPEDFIANTKTVFKAYDGLPRRTFKKISM